MLHKQKMKTINKLTLIAVLIFGYASNAQGVGANFNHLSVEGSYGVSIPLSYAHSPLTYDDYKSDTHFDLGIRYMFNQDWGLKGTLAYDKFTGDDASFGLKSFRIDAQGHYNLGKAIGLVLATRETVGMFVHSGFGVTLNNSIYKNDFQDETINYIIGLTPLIRISERIALSTDFSYIFNFKQDHYFDGVVIGEKSNTSQMTFSLGAVFYIGNANRHADWY
jgi:OOP family OmpA-OmpF porin